jgi:superfamily II DNA or RNA helicase
VDEAHHAPADSYQKVLGHYSQSKIVGVTATPDRSDEVALGRVFESVAFVYEITDAIRDGYLVPIEQESIRVAGLDYSACKVTAGDLNQGDIARAQGQEEVLAAMTKETVARAKDKKTIIFATPGFAKDDDYRISQRVLEIINGERPGSVRRVAQDTPKDERAQLLRDYTAGKFQFLVNVGVLTEGFDEPSIEVVAIMRPTQSRALFAQMIGRGTRTLPGVIDGLPFADGRRAAIAASRKPKVTVLDFEGNAGRHKLVHTADVLGGNYDDEVVAAATIKASKQGGDVLAHLDSAKGEVEAARREEQERRRVIAGKARVSAAQSVDPFDVYDIAPPVARGWDGGPTDKQRAVLEMNGVRVHENMTRPQASAIIGEIRRRQDGGRVGFKLAAELRTRGLPTDIGVGEAMNLLAKARKAVTA